MFKSSGHPVLFKPARYSTWQIALISFFILFFSLSAWSTTPHTAFKVPSDSFYESVNPHTMFYIDETKQLTFKDIRSPFRQAQFFNDNRPDVSFGFVDKSLWIKIPIDFSEIEDIHQRYVIAYNYEPAHKISLYYPDDNGKYQVKTTGFYAPPSTRDYKQLNFGFKINKPRNTSKADYYLHIENESPIPLIGNVFLASEIEYIQRSESLYTTLNILNGALIILLISNIILLWATRDLAQLWYVFYITCFIISYNHVVGYTSLFFDWLVSGEHRKYMIVFLYGFFIGTIQFTRHMLNTKILCPPFDQFLRLFLLLPIGALILSFVVNTGFGYYASTIIMSLLAIILPITGIFALYKKSDYAGYYILGWAVFAVFMALYTLQAQGIIDSIYLTKYGIQLGSIWEAATFSAALAIRNRNISVEREKFKHESDQKTAFVMNISHELRTPLNAIMGYLQLIERKSVDKETFNYIERIKSSSKTLHELIGDILDFGKVHSKKIVLEKNLIHIKNDLLNPMFEIFDNEARQKNISFNLKDKCKSTYVIGDAIKIKQVLINVIGNAIKFTCKGSVTLIANDFQRKDSIALTFSVEDTGIGIKPQDITKIFNVFEQSEYVNSIQHAGSGLGLSISQSLAKTMGGDITVHSRYGKGSTFVIALQLEKCSPHEIQSYAAKINQEKLKAGNNDCDKELHGKRVLVAEDNEGNQFLIKQFMKLLGINCTIVNNGQEAVDMTSCHQFDAILMDIQMPVMSGYLAAEAIRADHPGIPIIALTAGASKAYQTNAMQHGMNDFLSKPISIETLKATLIKWTTESFTHNTAQGEGNSQPVNTPEKHTINALDIEKLDTLTGGVKSLSAHYVNVCLHSLLNESGKLRSAYDNNDFETVQRLSHTIKGKVAIFKEDAEIVEIIQKIERYSLKGKPIRKQHWKNFEACVNQAVNELKLFSKNLLPENQALHAENNRPMPKEHKSIA